MPEPETVSIDQAAEIAGVSRRTIYYWIAAGKVTYRRTAGGSIRIDPESLWQKGSAREAKPATSLPHGNARTVDHETDAQ